MRRMYKYLFTDEWDEGGQNHVSAYGKRSLKEIDEIADQMERYSPYDYCCTNECDTEEEYNSRLQIRINDGDEVKYYNQ